MKFNWFKKDQIEDQKETTATAIAAPAPAPFQPINAVLPNQTIPGEFNYNSSTWKYLQTYLTNRIAKLNKRNENTSIDLAQTQVIRGQLKEIKLLLNHTNHLAGVDSSPTKQSLS
jgi:hypothetical protein